MSKIGIIQISLSTDIDNNITKTEKEIRACAKKGAQIIFLPELFKSEYFCWEENQNYFDLAEKIPGDTTSFFSKLAIELGVVIFLPLFEKRTEGLYHNTCAVIDADGSYLGKYRKKHIPDDPGFYEKYYFTPGDDEYKVFNTKHGKVGVLICWDQWYPEAARITSLKGAEILYYPTAIGWDPSETKEVHQEEQQAWETIQRSHAIANGVHVVSVNRVGTENGTIFWGNSFVCNPMGKVLHRCTSDQQEVAAVDIDLNRSQHYRQVWPFLRDRRIDTYSPILKRYLDNDDE